MHLKLQMMSVGILLLVVCFVLFYRIIMALHKMSLDTTAGTIVLYLLLFLFIQEAEREADRDCQQWPGLVGHMLAIQSKCLI